MVRWIENIVPKVLESFRVLCDDEARIAVGWHVVQDEFGETTSGFVLLVLQVVGLHQSGMDKAELETIGGVARGFLIQSSDLALNTVQLF